MRRLWSYIILAVSSLAIIAVSFVGVFTQTNTNIEFSEGKELTFRIEDKEDEDFEFDSYEAVNNIAESMIDRLEAQEVTQYEVTTHGYDTIKVKLEQDNTQNYEYIKKILTFSGSNSLALTTKLNDVRTAEEFRGEGKAYMEVENDYPTIRIPVGNQFSEILEIVRGYKEDNETKAAEASESQNDAGETETTYTYYLYLWYDYDPDTCTYEKTDTSSEEYDPHIAEKLFMTFDISNIEDDAEYLQAFVNIQDGNGDGEYEAKDVKAAYDTAKFYVNLINSSELDYNVTFLYENIVPAWTEEIISVSRNITWSNTLIATLCGIAVISLLLVVFYRLGSLSMITTTIASIFGAVAMIVVFTAEFNLAGLIGLIAIAITSLASGVIYMVKFKEECYRGRSLKKANAEGAKKALLPIVDIHVALIAIGVFSYIFGGAIMRGFAIITVLGGLISLILNTLGLRGMMWLATNTTKLQGKYTYFGVENKDVPNLLNEEKQTYFGPYAEKDFTKKKKPAAIIAIVCVLAGITGLTVFGIKDNGVMYNNGTTALASEIYVETNTKNSLITLDVVEDILENTYILSGETANTEKDTKLASYITLDADKNYKIDYETRIDIEENVEVTYQYYVVHLTKALSNDTKAYYLDGTTPVYTQNEGISQLITDQLVAYDSDAMTSVKDGKIVSAYEPDFMPIMWGTLVGVAVAAVYLMLRYRLSRGIAALLTTVGGTAAIAGIFALTRLPVTNYAAVAMPIIALIALILAVVFANKDREMFLEDKTHDNSIENRNAIMVKSNSLAFYPVLIIAILSLYIFVDFFGFGASGYSWLFMVLAIGVIAITAMMTFLYGPLSQLFFKLFANIKLGKFQSKRSKKRKANQKSNKKSSEPEEYVFIGIND